MEIEATDNGATGLVPYKPGISLRDVVKGTLTRFLPGSVIGMGVLTAIIPPGGISGLRLFELLVLHEVGPLMIGFGLGLLGLHGWLYPDSEVTGRKSFVAGILTPIAMLGAGVLIGLLGFMPRFQPGLVSFIVGIVMALAMFFPWLSPTPEERRPDRYESDEPEQLPAG
jgi:hypothetical protein